MLVIIAFIATLLALSKLASLETRRFGAPRLAPMLFFAFIGGIIFLFYLDDAMVSPRSEERVRELFHLPDSVDLKRHGRHGGASCYTHSMYSRATVQFTPEQFATYVGSIHDRSVWRPVIPLHYVAEKSSVRFSDDALVWQSLPEPPWMGKQQLVWNIAGAQVRRGLAQCYEFSRVEQSAQATGDDGRVAYTVAACNPRARPRTPAGGARVTAALDSDKQQLNVTLHFDSKPDYCNNRVSKFIGAALGLDAM
jgi:hypothetical protein